MRSIRRSNASFSETRTLAIQSGYPLYPRRSSNRRSRRVGGRGQALAILARLGADALLDRAESRFRPPSESRRAAARRAPSRSRASKRGRAAGETGGTAARTGSASPERQRDGFAQRQRRPRVPLQTEPVAEPLAGGLRSPLHQGKRVASLEPLPTLSGNRLGRREQSCRCPRIALHAHAPECCKRFDGERRGLELDRRPESLLENRPRGLVLAV